MADQSTDTDQSRQADWQAAMAVKDLQPTVTLSALPTLSVLEVDRFCPGCGYNLRQQGVKREPTTKLLLVQCPECGKLEPAASGTAGVGRTYLIWLARLLIVAWLGLLLLGAWIAGVCYYALAWTAVTFKVTRHWDGDGYSLLRARSYPGKAFEQAIVFGLAVFCAWFIVGLLGVVFPHWKKWGHGLAVSLIVFGGAAAAWADQSYFLQGGTALLPEVGIAIGSVVFLGLLGGIVALWTARPVVRGIIRLIVPPSLRPPLAYLWLIDGKPLPPMRDGAGQRLLDALDRTLEPDRKI